MKRTSLIKVLFLNNLNYNIKYEHNNEYFDIFFKLPKKERINLLSGDIKDNYKKRNSIKN